LVVDPHGRAPADMKIEALRAKHLRTQSVKLCPTGGVC
jgi:hypothetical protein